MNFVQTKTVRDAAAMLDCVAIPQPGDPFIIPKPDEPYASLARKPPGKLKIGIVLDELVGMKVDPEVARAVEATGKTLAGMGHTVERASADMGGRDALAAAFDIFFFGFDVRLDGYAKRSGHKVGPDTLEPVILAVYEAAKDITPARFIAACNAANVARRKLGAFYTKYDIWLSPTTSRVPSPGAATTCRAPERLGRHDRQAVHPALPVHRAAQHHGHAGHVAAARHAFDGRADRRADRSQACGRAPAAAARRRPRAGHALEGPRPAAARVEGVSGTFIPSPTLLFWSAVVTLPVVVEMEMVNAAIEEGFEVFASETGKPFGAVRHVSMHGRPELVIYVENSGEYTVSLDAVTAVHSEKVIVDVGKLDKRLRAAIGHAHDAEDPNI